MCTALQDFPSHAYPSICIKNMKAALWLMDVV